MRFFSNRRGMTVKRAGRILAAIVLTGLLVTFFVGDIALKVAGLIAGLVMMSWLVMDYVREIRNPLRHRSLGTVMMITVEYAVLLSIVGVFLVGVFKSIVS